jgi:lipopolysaccharide/colanic/teichoic acid biosynthesis glycosyltransferase
MNQKSGLFRYIYFLFVASVIIILSPLFLCIGILIFLNCGGPVIFTQKRIGKNGKTFTLYKFRTMNKDAEAKQDHYKKLNEADGPVFKIHDDPRFTSIGRFLSHTGLDELPQLFNILKGDMALIGPRPLPVEETKKLKDWQKKRHTIKPGIISPWIVQGYHRQSFDAWMKSDIWYVSHKSMLYDSGLMAQFIPLIVRLIVRESGNTG